MMKVLLVEDEKPAARHLLQLIREVDASITVEGPIDTVKNTVKYLNQNPPPDLIFLDIQLGDGISFEIFEMVDVRIPIIFTTAYDEYALKAFKVNSIDYLLKPIDKHELKEALGKFYRLQTDSSASITPEQIKNVLDLIKNQYKTRFIVKTGDRIKSIPVDDILYFFSREKATFFHSKDGINYITESTLDQLEDLLDPARFFRVNRKCIIAMESIEKISTYFNNRLILNVKSSENVIVSRDRVKNFKSWLDR